MKERDNKKVCRNKVCLHGESQKLHGQSSDAHSRLAIICRKCAAEEVAKSWEDPPAIREQVANRSW